MGGKTRISWAETGNADGSVTQGSTWNPISGCTKVSAECTHCYAERDWARLAYLPAYAGREFSDVACHFDRLDQPFHWQRPRRIAVCSIADMFHADIPESFVDDIFATMALCPQHTFYLLTKRADVMQAYLSAGYRARTVQERVLGLARDRGIDFAPQFFKWPLPNVWVGVSTGYQETADERIPLLLQSPAAKRWACLEPLLGPVDLQATPANDYLSGCSDEPGMVSGPRLDWVVVEGESGPNARPMHPDWVRSVRDQCAATGTPFFFKQHGEWAAIEMADWDGKAERRMVNFAGWAYLLGSRDDTGVGFIDSADRPWVHMVKVGRKIAGDRLDGIEHKESPVNA